MLPIVVIKEEKGYGFFKFVGDCIMLLNLLRGRQDLLLL